MPLGFTNGVPKIPFGLSLTKFSQCHTKAGFNGASPLAYSRQKLCPAVFLERKMKTGRCHSNSLQEPETLSAKSTMECEFVLDENFSAGSAGAESACDALSSKET